MDTIRCYEGDYDKAVFYAKMGRFFAEERYIRQMPYLLNKPDKVWFTIERNERVIAFSSLEFRDDYILFTTEYVEGRYRRNGLFRALTDARFAYCEELDLPIKTSTNIGFIRDYYLRRGFEIYRSTKNYWFLCRSQKERSHADSQNAARISHR